MEIERLLQIAKHETDEKEVVKMILSNRIDYQCGGDIGVAVTIKQWDLLADDFIAWRNNKFT